MKPILFNTEMVRAILEGRKTVTRRAVKPQPTGDGSKPEELKTRPGCWNAWGDDNVYRQPYAPGDILWVRETWAKIWYVDQNGCTYYDQPMYYYAADGTPDITLVDEDGFEKDDQRIRWHPSIHMPREAARIFLQVKDVQVERLLTPFFSDGAAVLTLRQEGMTLPRECVECIGNYGTPACIDTSDDSECGILDEIRGYFSDLWDRTMKPADLPLYGWEANPWVWVIEFERISKEEALGGGGDAN